MKVVSDTVSHHRRPTAPCSQEMPLQEKVNQLLLLPSVRCIGYFWSSVSLWYCWPAVSGYWTEYLTPVGAPILHVAHFRIHDKVTSLLYIIVCSRRK